MSVKYALNVGDCKIWMEEALWVLFPFIQWYCKGSDISTLVFDSYTLT